MTQVTETTRRVRLVGVREQPLDVDEVLASVEDQTSGAVNLFIGRVRNHDEGRGVSALDYSAHPTATQRMREVCEAIAAAHDVTAVSAVHRVGPLAIGDAAVVVAVSAAHRDTAYVASRALIDQIKAEVPIWKHQQFTDGGPEWVGAPKSGG